MKALCVSVLLSEFDQYGRQKTKTLQYFRQKNRENSGCIDSTDAELTDLQKILALRLKQRCHVHCFLLTIPECNALYFIDAMTRNNDDL